LSRYIRISSRMTCFSVSKSSARRLGRRISDSTEKARGRYSGRLVT
jgi:hypothetical protein